MHTSITIQVKVIPCVQGALHLRRRDDCEIQFDTYMYLICSVHGLTVADQLVLSVALAAVASVPVGVPVAGASTASYERHVRLLCLSGCEGVGSLVPCQTLGKGSLVPSGGVALLAAPLHA